MCYAVVTASITKMRKRSFVLDEAEDIFASSESEPSLSDGDRVSDEDFIVEDGEPTSALDPRDQLRIDKNVYARAHRDEWNLALLGHTEKGKSPRQRGSGKKTLRHLSTSCKGTRKICTIKGNRPFVISSQFIFLDDLENKGRC